jgi:Icc-related predicted phosphoesterase
MNTSTHSPKGEIFFAAVGDVHDHFSPMEAMLSAWERKQGRRIDFILQVGDLQACRDVDDLDTVAIPRKYRHLGDFQQIWRQGRGLSRPTYFIGGNHEPFGWLDQHVEGAELMANLHYLGRAGAAQIAGLKVLGLTGIYSETHGNESRPPVEKIMETSRKRYTFYNAGDVERVAELGPADILLLHEWPKGLLSGEPPERWQRWLRATQPPEDFGSEEGRLLVDLLRPRYVFCGHMHVAHDGWLDHPGGSTSRVICLNAVPDPGCIRYFSLRNQVIEEIQSP